MKSFETKGEFEGAKPGTTVSSPSTTPPMSKYGQFPIGTVPVTSHSSIPADITAASAMMANMSVGGNVPQVSTGVYSPLNDHSPNRLISLITQQEPKVADTAPPMASLPCDLQEHMMWNRSPYRIPEHMFDADHEKEFSSSTDSAPNSGNFWTENLPPQQKKEQMLAFDFIVKSIAAANNYVSMLNREQADILKSVDPKLLYSLLVNVCDVQNTSLCEKRSRRAALNHGRECAFCKNNGENEENYSSHQLKDSRGVVLCPVLRAFRCPRCGATGDRAHTIKYCPDNNDNMRSNFSSRRRSSIFMDDSSGNSGTGSSSTLPTNSIYSNNYSQNLGNSNFTSMDTLFGIGYRPQDNLKETTAFGNSTTDETSSSESTPAPENRGRNNQWWPFLETKS